MSRLDYAIKEEKEKKAKADDKEAEEKKIAPFIGYGENAGIKADQAKAIFYSVRGALGKKEDQDPNDFGPKQMGMLWGEYKKAIKDAGGVEDSKKDENEKADKEKDKKDSKKEAIVTTRNCIIEGYYIKENSIIEVVKREISAGANSFITTMKYLLEKNPVMSFGKPINFTDITSEESYSSVAVVEGRIEVDSETFIFTMFYYDGESPKELVVGMTSLKRRGSFEKKFKGKNATPEVALQTIFDIFDLKYKR
jgi:hypothetical protein